MHQFHEPPSLTCVITKHRFKYRSVSHKMESKFEEMNPVHFTCVGSSQI